MFITLLNSLQKILKKSNHYLLLLLESRRKTYTVLDSILFDFRMKL